MITILTPTYNRAHLLHRVFESLQNQTSKNFEWLIIDDGSQDNTADIVHSFFPKNFEIHYHKKANGGKHTALNFGVQKAKGEFIVMLDSDDTLLHHTIETLEKKIKSLPPHLGGIVGRRRYLNGKIVGSQDNFTEIISNSLNIRYQHNVTGDLVEVFKTSVMKEFPFPIFDKEKFCPEALVWNRIAQKYDLLFFNESIYQADYQPGGLTDTITKIRMQSPKASMTHYSELASYKIPLKEKIKASINFWRFSFNDNDLRFGEKWKKVNPFLSLMGLPLGFAMYINDWLKK